MKSNCCDATIDIWYSDEGTGCYVCTKCYKACDPKPKHHPGCGIRKDGERLGGFCGCGANKSATKKNFSLNRKVT